MGPKKYATEVIKEGKRVRWPKREVFWPTVVVVLIIAAFVALFLMLEDYAAGILLKQLKDAFRG